MSYLNDRFLGDLGWDPFKGIQKATSKVFKPVFKPPSKAVMTAGQQFGGAIKTAALNTSKEVGKGLTQATLATGTALKQTGIAVTNALKTLPRLVSKKGGRVVDEDSGPIALPERNLFGWSVFADLAIPGDPTLSPGTDAEAENPAWPGYFATKGSERLGPYTWERLQAEILKRPAPALDESGTQSTWQGWAFWMIPATPAGPSGKTDGEDWPGFYAEKAGTKTAMGTATAVLKDVQDREAASMPDQELPPGETNPYLGWALWWHPSEGDAGIYGKKNGVETIHGTADAVATDIQNREKAAQPQTPSGGVETYSGQDYQGWQLWSSMLPTGGQQWFGVQGSTRTPLYADAQQLYSDIQNRMQPQQPTIDPGYQPSPYQPSPYQPSPYSPSPMTGGGGSFTPWAPRSTRLLKAAGTVKAASSPLTKAAPSTSTTAACRALTAEAKSRPLTKRPRTRQLSMIRKSSRSLSLRTPNSMKAHRAASPASARLRPCPPRSCP